SARRRSRTVLGQIAVAQRARLLALPVLVALGGALVGLLLAARETDLDLGDAALVEVDRQRHQCHALAFRRAQQLVALLAVEQQLARPPFLVVEAVGRFVYRDMGIEQPQLALHLAGIGFRDAGMAAAQALHLAAQQHDAGLQRLVDEVIVAGAAILRDETIGAAHHHLLTSPSPPWWRGSG